MQQPIRKIANGTLNTDDHLTSVAPEYPQGDYVDSVDTRLSSIDGFNNSRVSILGNTEVLNELLPDGDNYGIGTYEDPNGKRVFLFNHNSEGNHGVYEYNPVSDNWRELVVGEALRFNRQWKVHSVNLINNDLLQWTDGRVSNNNIVGNGLRSISVEKAANRNRSFEIIFEPDKVLAAGVTTTFVSILLTSPEGEETIGFAYPTGSTFIEWLQSLADNLNDVFANIEFEACEGSMIANVLPSGKYTIEATGFIYEGASVSEMNILEVPHNFYPDPLRVEHIDRAKYSPLCPPSFTYINDASRKQNFIKDNWFQFAVQYEYDNAEISPISPVSELAFGQAFCGASDSNNCIIVDFTDNRLNDTSSLAILKRVNLLVRFGDLREWRLVKSMDRWEIPIGRNTFRFCNDGNYPVVSTDLTDYRQNIPQKALAQSFVANRGYISGTQEGFDNLCVDASASLSYASECEPKQFGTITAKVVIRVPYAPGYSQAIWQKDDGTTVYGGITGTYPTPDDPVNVQQEIPLAGFLAYAVGTPYTAISRQVVPAGSPWLSVVPGEENVFDVSTPSRHAAVWAEVTAGTIYSELSLSLPPGRHIIRLASHQIGPEKTGLYEFPGGGYQRTSTYLKAFPSNANTPYSDVCEIIVDVEEGATSDIGTIEVYDFAQYGLLHGYCFDSAEDTDAEDVIAGATVEKMAVTGTTADVSCFNNAGYTDHNGFFFLAKFDSSVLWNPIFTSNGNVFRTTLENFFSNSLNELFNDETPVLVSLYTTPARNGKGVVFYSTNDPLNFRENARTIIQGNVQDESGDPIAGIPVICSLTGRIFNTDGDGQYSGVVYGNSATIGQRIAYQIIKPSAACCIDFIAPIPDQDYLLSFINAIGTVYTNTSPFNALAFIISIEGSAIDLKWKHGNKVDIGLVYLDEAGRRTSVQASDALEVLIPDITDEGGDPSSPIIQLSINHQPPEEAVKCLVVRKLNPLTNRYLQFIVGEIKYVTLYDSFAEDPEPVETSYGAGDAKEIYLSLIPIINYAQENTGSVLSYIPEPGDRVKLLRNDEGNLFSEYYDFEMSSRGEGSSESPLTIIIKNDNSLPQLFPGTFVELYTPKLKVDDDFYFEFGQCIDILDPRTENRRHGAGKDGVAQVIGVSPATAFLYGGDTFVRTREMFYLDGVEKNYFIRKCEDEYIYDDNIESKQRSIGHPNIEDERASKFFHYSRTRVSDIFNVNGDRLYNGLSKFNFSDFKDADRGWGPIHKLVRVGEKHELLAIQSFKIQPIYINAIPIETVDTAEGRTAITKALINLYQPFKSPFGTQNPESVVQDGNNVWAYDRARSVIWYYALNDPADISTYYKIRTTIQEITQRGEPFGDRFFCMGAIDRKNKEVVWAFQEAVNVLPGPGGGGDAEEEDAPGGGETGRFGAGEETFDPVTIAFSYREQRKGWESRRGYFPECMIGLGETRFYSVKNGRLYIHDTGNACEWYGEKKSAFIKMPITAQPSAVKDWIGGRVKSIRLWHISDIQLPPTDTYGIGMKSRVSGNNFTLAEGDYWFSFLNDMNTPGFDSEVEALFRGRTLKGSIILLNFENGDNEQASIDCIDVFVSPSLETL